MNNRRQFLKSVFGVISGLAILPSVVKAKPEVFIYGTTKDFIEAGQPKKAGVLRDGLKNAFCYGGKLFRVYPGYFDEGFTMMQVRGGPFHNNEFNYVLTDESFNNIEYRHSICESMLKAFEN